VHRSVDGVFALWVLTTNYFDVILWVALKFRAVSLETLGLEVSRVSTNFPVSSPDTISPSIETFDTEKNTRKTYPTKNIKV
jgi:hypothetical protein